MTLINCEDCGSEVSTKAESCPNCGCPISQKEEQTSSNDAVDSKSVRTGNVQAEQNRKAAGCLTLQITIIAIIAGMWQSSWVVGGGVFLGSIIFLSNQTLAKIMGFALSIAWAGVGWLIGMEAESTEASIVLALLGFMISFGMTLQGSKFVGDVQEQHQ